MHEIWVLVCIWVSRFYRWLGLLFSVLHCWCAIYVWHYRK